MNQAERRGWAILDEADRFAPDDDPYLHFSEIEAEAGTDPEELDLEDIEILLADRGE